MDVRALVNARPTGRRPQQIRSGIVSLEKPAPQSFGDPVYVALDGGVNPEGSFPYPWRAVNGVALPKQGAACLLAEDENGIPHVIDWDGTHSGDATAYVDAFWKATDSDWTAAILRAVDTLPQTGNTETSGGTVAFTPGKSYSVKGTLDFDGLVNLRLTGQTSGMRGGAQIVADFSTGSSATLISAKSSLGLCLDGGLALVNADATYTGTMLDLSKGTGQNTDFANITGCRIDMAASVSATATGILLRNAQALSIDRMFISGGQTAIRGMTTAGDFCNGISIARCYFENQVSSPIVDLGQACAVRSCVFEPEITGNARAYFQDVATPCSGLEFSGNYCGDANTSGAWLTLAGAGISVIGNQFWDGNTAFLTSGNCDGLSITGNVLKAMSVGLDPSTGSHTRVIYLGNGLSSVTTPLATTTTLGTGSVVDNNGTLLAKGGFTSF